MDMPVLVDQQELIYFNSLWTFGCNLEDLPRAINDKDGWRERKRESQGNPCCQRDSMIMIYNF